MLSHPRRRGGVRALACVALAALPLGCSSAPDAAQPDQVVDGTMLHVAVRPSPNPPMQGTISVELTVTSKADGTPQDGLAISMVPWMPADDHGTSPTPAVTAEGAGKYLVSPINFFMAGHWVLQTSFSGPVTDYVAPAYDVQ